MIMVGSGIESLLHSRCLTYTQALSAHDSSATRKPAFVGARCARPVSAARLAAGHLLCGNSSSARGALHAEAGRAQRAPTGQRSCANTTAPSRPRATPSAALGGGAD